MRCGHNRETVWRQSFLVVSLRGGGRTQPGRQRSGRLGRRTHVRLGGKMENRVEFCQRVAALRLTMPTVSFFDSSLLLFETGSRVVKCRPWKVALPLVLACTSGLCKLCLITSEPNGPSLERISTLIAGVDFSMMCAAHGRQARLQSPHPPTLRTPLPTYVPPPGLLKLRRGTWLSCMRSSMTGPLHQSP